MSIIRIVVDNLTRCGLAVEHGLALLIDCGDARILLDTGAGGALMANLAALGIEATSIQNLVLSHGHWDHTGALAELLAPVPSLPIYAAAGVLQERFSCHPGQAARDVSMQLASRRALAQAQYQELHGFTLLSPGLYATGPIARESGEDCGGPFYLDASAQTADLLPDDQALLLTEGVLVLGCCHSGIINTIEHCRRCAPEVKIHSVIGGMHLVNADTARLERTAAYLEAQGLRRIIACHCSGEQAIAYLQERLSCELLVGASGDSYEF
jgi:7,8-dihydropterin-6-yl-methyl-4-(beta-D-ribofuranosyl)aminobenzene 5'-phosphate synthase